MKPFTSISLRSETHKKLKVAAAKKGVSFSKYLDSFFDSKGKKKTK